ncbi:conjugal transfer protein TraD [Candidatus Tisiphia endosymbiont of Micropterix aruncella]|uniref:conjugal transfer protein TraD n=1 Tax=Candidatus Tisiphia endosymbiont of Micropterix aruncella TaxID=3066271 RepID=UPI003AA968B7
MNNQSTNYLERKQDTRKKIMLGGLIIKAGLDYLHPKDTQALYGMLLVIVKYIELGDKEHRNSFE